MTPLTTLMTLYLERPELPVMREDTEDMEVMEEDLMDQVDPVGPVDLAGRPMEAGPTTEARGGDLEDRASRHRASSGAAQLDRNA